MSKKTVSIVLSLIICLALTAASLSVYADNENLFDEVNASCEVLNDFNINSVYAVQREISNTVCHSGSGSLKITIPGTYQDYAGFKPTENLVEDERYTFSVWYYNPDNITGRMFLRFTSVTGNSIANWVTGTAFDSGAPMSPGGWNKYEFTFTATNKVATDLKYFYITTESGAGKTLYFDDALLKVRDPSDDYKAMVYDDIAACESDAALAAFNTNTYNDNPNISREISTEYAHSGDGSLKINIPNPGTYKTFAGISPSASLKLGGEYYFSFWYYNPENISGKLYLRFTSITGGSISNWVTGTAFDSGEAMSQGGWYKYEYTFTATDKLVTDLKYFYVTADGGNGKTLYFDDFNLRLISEESPVLQGISPDTGSENVKPGGEVRLDFNGEVDSTDVDAEYYLNGEKQENKAFKCVSDGKSLLIKPNGGLLPGAEYKFIINKVNDVCGRTVLENQTVEFKTSDKIDFKVKLYDENNTEINSVKKGTLKAEIDLTNNMGSSAGCIAVIMVCEGERVNKVYFTPALNLAEDENKTENLTVEIPSETSYIKAFLWSDATDNLRAMAKDIELT